MNLPSNKVGAIFVYADKKDLATVKTILGKLPSRARAGLTSIKCDKEGIENVTFMRGDIVGKYQKGGFINLYPGWNEDTLIHEIGHHLHWQNRMWLVDWKTHLNKKGLKPKGGYGTSDSAFHESFANSFSEYIRYGYGKEFWGAKIG